MINAFIDNDQHIELSISAQLINTSSVNHDLIKLRYTIIQQIKQAYTVPNLNLTCNIAVNVIQRKNQIKQNVLLFQVVDTISGGNPAEADFKGLRIKLNSKHISSFIDNANNRTIPHELGHCLGWDHPHARGQFGISNKDADFLYEQTMTEEERCINLMSQTWYIQKAERNINDAKNITAGQLKLLLKNIEGNLLNKNKHLIKYWFWNRLIN